MGERWVQKSKTIGLTCHYLVLDLRPPSSTSLLLSSPSLRASAIPIYHFPLRDRADHASRIATARLHHGAPRSRGGMQHTRSERDRPHGRHTLTLPSMPADSTRWPVRGNSRIADTPLGCAFLCHGARAVSQWECEASDPDQSPPATKPAPAQPIPRVDALFPEATPNGPHQRTSKPHTMCGCTCRAGSSALAARPCPA